MTTLFGNFDAKARASRYIIPQATVSYLKGQELSNLISSWGSDSGDEVLVHPLRVLESQEDGKQKFILVTYVVPEDHGTYDCHACRPMIGIAVFVHDEQRWTIESARDMIVESGGFGEPARDFRVVKVGPQRIGIEMTDGEDAQGETIAVKTIFAAWNGKVNEAIHFFAHDDDLAGSPDLPRYSNHRSLSFVQGENADYFDIVLTLSGTDMTDSPHYRRVSVHGVERLAFFDGFYKSQTRTGDTTWLERAIEDERKVQSATPPVP